MIEEKSIKQLYFDREIAPFVPTNAKFVTPLCAYFPICGGCQLQELSYRDQLVWKRNRLLYFLSQYNLDLGHLTRETVGMSSDPFYYRNKADFTSKTWDGLVHLGFRPYGGKGPLIEMDECPLLLKPINKALEVFRPLLYDEKPLMYMRKLQKRQVALFQTSVVEPSLRTEKNMFSVVVSW
mgnify:CR=1 FL=1